MLKTKNITIMRAIHNPYEQLINDISEVKKLLIELKNVPKEDYTNKYYTYHQVAELLHVDYQSIRNYVNSGFLKAEEVGPRKKLIHHYQIFNEDQTLKNLKYKRKA